MGSSGKWWAQQQGLGSSARARVDASIAAADVVVSDWEVGTLVA